MGSITFLFMAQILSHSMKTTDLDEPWAKINCLRASMVRPRRRTPRTVGNLGSSQPSTLLLSTNQVSLRFDITYEQLIKRWKFVIIWMDGSVLKIQHYTYQLARIFHPFDEVPSVVYFNQLLGAACMRKLVELLFSAFSTSFVHFKPFLFILHLAHFKIDL